MTLPLEPGNIADLKYRELQSTRTGERYSFSASLSDVFGFKNVSVRSEVIPPGHRASAAHAHRDREEMVYVLEGEPTVHVNNQERVLKPGEFFGFAPGPASFHFIRNDSRQMARVLLIASHPEGDKTHYPD